MIPIAITFVKLVKLTPQSDRKIIQCEGEHTVRSYLEFLIWHCPTPHRSHSLLCALVISAHMMTLHPQLDLLCLLATNPGIFRACVLTQNVITIAPLFIAEVR